MKRLETSGLVRIARRLIRTPYGARQATNAYAFSESAFGARKPDYENSRETTNLLKNIQDSLLCRVFDLYHSRSPCDQSSKPSIA